MKTGNDVKTLPALTGIKTPVATQDCIGIQKGLTGFKRWRTIQMVNSGT